MQQSRFLYNSGNFTGWRSFSLNSSSCRDRNWSSKCLVFHSRALVFFFASLNRDSELIIKTRSSLLGKEIFISIHPRLLSLIILFFSIYFYFSNKDNKCHSQAKNEENFIVNLHTGLSKKLNFSFNKVGKNPCAHMWESNLHQWP